MGERKIQVWCVKQVCDRKNISDEGKLRRNNKINGWNKWRERVSCITSNVFVCVCAVVHLTASRSDNLLMSSFHLLSPSLFFLPDLWVSLFCFFPHLFHRLGVKRLLLICSALGCYGNCPDGQDLEFGSSFTSQYLPPPCQDTRSHVNKTPR